MKTMIEKVPGSYARVNGLNVYREVHGAGKPLVVLHGGFGVIGMFASFEQLLLVTSFLEAPVPEVG